MMNYFKARREQLDLTQKNVADRIGVTVPAVSNWERGSPPEARQWDAIAEVLQVPVSRVSTEVLKMIRERRKPESAATSAA